MFGSMRSPLSSIVSASSSPYGASSFASSSRHVLSPVSRSAVQPVQLHQVRHRTLLAPRRTKYRKSMKGFPITVPVGGSIKGTTVSHGQFGLRILEPARLTAAILTSCRDAIKKKIKPTKGAEVFMRVFPDVPVAVKGNEVRMGKGKGSFEYWAARVRMGKVLFEVGGGGIREEVAKSAFRVAQAKLPVRSEVITSATPPRLGRISSHDLQHPAGRQPIPALLREMEANRNFNVINKINKRNFIRQREIAREKAGLVVRAPRMILKSVKTARLEAGHSTESLDSPKQNLLEGATA